MCFRNSVIRIRRLIDNEQPISTKSSAFDSKSSAFDFGAYHDLSGIYSWLDQLLEAHPRVLTGYTVGYSFEGRTIRGLRLSYKQV